MLGRGFYRKRMMAAVLFCVMVATAIAPCAVGGEEDPDFTVTRRPPGAPSVNEVVHEWTATSDGTMWIYIENHGLASVTLDIRTGGGTLWAGPVRFQGDTEAKLNSPTVQVTEGDLVEISAIPGGSPESYACLWVCFEPQATSAITYTIYDMFGEPWGEWWNIRAAGGWDTERLLTSEDGEVTYLYSTTKNPPSDGTAQGLIYAPYRWNVDATAIPNLDVHDPVFMPRLGSSVTGAEASMEVRFQYLYAGEDGEWADVWIPEWGESLDFMGGTLEGDFWSCAEWVDAVETNHLAYTDGYLMGTMYEITMNREAALEWIGLPVSSEVSTWWSSEKSGYIADWETWIDDQANDVFDIMSGYEAPYSYSGTMMTLEEDEGAVVMRIAHMSYGYEALMTRWLKHTAVSMHQPYMEDFTMTVNYRESDVDLELDAVAQWSLHCVKQDGATGDGAPCAWAWEPIALDYTYYGAGHPSDYEPYATMEYTSWNCGDVQYGDSVSYEGTPVEMDLLPSMKLVVILPTDPVPGYDAEDVPDNAIYLVWTGDTSVYDGLRCTGTMSFGHMEMGPYTYDVSEVGNVLTITGPANFENPHPEDSDLLYHGAPWLEFNVD